MILVSLPFIDLYTVRGFDSFSRRYVYRTLTLSWPAADVPARHRFQPRECVAPLDVPAHPLTMTELCRLQITSILYIWTHQERRAFEPNVTREVRSSQAVWREEFRMWALSKAPADGSELTTPRGVRTRDSTRGSLNQLKRAFHPHVVLKKRQKKGVLWAEHSLCFAVPSWQMLRFVTTELYL